MKNNKSNSTWSTISLIMTAATVICSVISGAISPKVEEERIKKAVDEAMKNTN